MNLRTFIPVDKAAFHRLLASEPETRYEFAHGRIVEMHGGTNRHFKIAQRFLRILLAQLREEHWAVFQEFGVETPGTVRFPDVVVLPASDPQESRWTGAPALVVEVLSPSTNRLDLDEKPLEYMQLQSLQACIVASQSEQACLAWVRDENGKFPSEPTEYEASGTIAVPSLGVAIAVGEVYSGIDLAGKSSNPHG